ncbi:secreted RxLR effector protein 161-like [Belonocnema kinseyi]|uniref:secreted RxLR effector protein 161-like n=1 Tax=Belonocnema kinseyi TaxID=2817044 RepID=UPI00143D0DD0|nr:secreted RxLR effector protein 161-like [Belonocnema kinseyi]
MQDANLTSVPAEPGVCLSKSESEYDVKIPHREAIGSLLFAARISRPDIEFAVNCASQFLNCYNQTHWLAVKKIMLYLNGTLNYGIIYGNSGSTLDIKGYTDADFAGCKDTRRSRSCFVFLLNGGPISWTSRRQNVVAVSTVESEYIALFHGVKEAVWLRRMPNELNVNCDLIPVLVDNQAAINISDNSDDHKGSKHIDVAS